MPPKRHLTLGTKLDVLGEIKKRRKVREIAHQFGIGVATVCAIKNDEEKLLNLASEPRNRAKTVSNRLDPLHLELDKRMMMWFCSIRSKNVTVDGPTMKMKALEIANAIGLMEFKASNGWLHKFKIRHNITSHQLQGESSELNADIVRNWKENFAEILAGYKPEDIFNTDETDLLWRGSPNRTIMIRGESSADCKQAKERMSVLLTASATGEKLPPLIIWKSRMPRAFNDVIPSGMKWFWNSEAWMTSSIFDNFLTSWNEELKTTNRRVLLLLDNAPYHTVDVLAYSNVKLIFLPPNTTAGTQPMDAGIIKSFKLHYKRLMTTEMLRILDRNETTNGDFIRSINVKQAVDWIKVAWNRVTIETIASCFRHFGIGNIDNTIDAIAGEQMDDLMARLFDLGIEDPELLCDNDVTAFDINENPEITVLQPIIMENKDSDHDDDDDILPPKRSWKQANDALQILYEWNFYADRLTYEQLETINATLRQACPTQRNMKITDFIS